MTAVPGERSLLQKGLAVLGLGRVGLLFGFVCCLGFYIGFRVRACISGGSTATNVDLEVIELFGTICTRNPQSKSTALGFSTRQTA